MMLSIEQIMNCASLLNIVPQKIDKVRTWLKSIKERIIQVEGFETRIKYLKEINNEN